MSFKAYAITFKLYLFRFSACQSRFIADKIKKRHFYVHTIFKRFQEIFALGIKAIFNANISRCYPRCLIEKNRSFFLSTFNYKIWLLNSKRMLITRVDDKLKYSAYKKISRLMTSSILYRNIRPFMKCHIKPETETANWNLLLVNFKFSRSKNFYDRN